MWGHVSMCTHVLVWTGAFVPGLWYSLKRHQNTLVLHIWGSALVNIWILGWMLSYSPYSGAVGKESACNAGDPVLIPESERSPGEGNATHSSILAWRIPWAEEMGGLQSMRLQRVRHDWATNNFHFSYIYMSSCAVCRILVPWAGTEPVPSAVKLQNPNHSTAREFPPHFIFLINLKNSPDASLCLKRYDLVVHLFTQNKYWIFEDLKCVRFMLNPETKIHFLKELIISWLPKEVICNTMV